MIAVGGLWGSTVLSSSSACAVARKPGAPSKFTPAYLSLEKSGELKRRELAIKKIFDLRACCPRRCDKNRKKHEPPVCGYTQKLKVSSAFAHFGEERPLVGRNGSGTIFFSNCCLLCDYCLNWELAHRGDGEFISHQRLAGMMLRLQRQGCHNINFVTPTHMLQHIISALRIAIGKGLRLPLVYNTGGYDRIELIKLLDGVFDIYMPDFKYQESELAGLYSLGASDYPEVAALAIKEMHQQVGTLKVDERGLAKRGVILRHLVLPNNIAGTDKFVRWVAKELSPKTYVNIMSQYRPLFRAKQVPELNRRITIREWRQALKWAKQSGLSKLD
jgi:putative pyruvate formate lyase activating enzyme